MAWLYVNLLPPLPLAQIQRKNVDKILNIFFREVINFKDFKEKQHYYYLGCQIIFMSVL